MLICTRRDKDEKNIKYTVFDTQTGINYHLFICMGVKRPIDMKIGSVHGLQDSWSLSYSGKEALSAWGQLGLHKEAHRVSSFLDCSLKNASDVLKISQGKMVD